MEHEKWTPSEIREQLSTTQTITKVLLITTWLTRVYCLLQVRPCSPSAFLYSSDPLGSPPPAHMGGIPYSLDPSKGTFFKSEKSFIKEVLKYKQERKSL